MRSCCAFNCQERSTKNSKLTFHKFPLNSKRRKMWIRAVCRKDPITGDIWIPNRHHTLCAKHFTDDMFVRTAKYIRLRKDAVPSIFDGIPKHLQIKVVRKKVDKQGNMIVPSQSKAPLVEYLPSQEVSNNSLSSESRCPLTLTKPKTRSEVSIASRSDNSSPPNDLPKCEAKPVLKAKCPKLLTKCKTKSEVLIASGSDNSSPSTDLAKCKAKHVLKHPEAAIADAVDYTLEEYKNILSTQVQEPECPKMLTKCKIKSKVSIAPGSDNSLPSNNLAKCEAKHGLKHPEAAIADAVDYTLEEYKNILSTQVQEPKGPKMLTKCKKKSEASIASGSDNTSPTNDLAKCDAKHGLKHPEADMANAVVYTLEEYKNILSTQVQSLEEEKSTVDGDWSDSSSSSRSPSKDELKRKIFSLEIKLLNSAKKIKSLQQSNRRWQHQVEELKTIVKTMYLESFNCENSSVNILKLKNDTSI